LNSETGYAADRRARRIAAHPPRHQGNGTGEPVTAADLNYFVNAWAAGGLVVADVTTQGAASGDPMYGVPDALVSASDLNYFVNAWVAGCP